LVSSQAWYEYAITRAERKGLRKEGRGSRNEDLSLKPGFCFDTLPAPC
jgi:hypothetical protein